MKQIKLVIILLTIFCPAKQVNSQVCPNLVNNGNFNATASGGIASEFASGYVTNWNYTWGTPQVSNIIATPDLPTYAKFWSTSTEGEGIMTPLSTIAGVSYVVKFWYQRGLETSNTVDNLIFRLFNVAGSGFPTGFFNYTIPTIPSGQNVVTMTGISTTAWTEATFCFTATSSYTDLLIYTINNTGTTGATASWIYLDAIRVFEVELNVPNIGIFCNTPTIIGPSCGLPTDIATYTWSPTTGLNNPSIANPSVSLTSDQVYTVALSIPACPLTISDNVFVDVPIPPVNLGPNQTICSPINLCTALGTGYTYLWSVPGACLYGNNCAQTCVSGNYCVTVTNSSGCSATDCAYIL